MRSFFTTQQRFLDALGAMANRVLTPPEQLQITMNVEHINQRLDRLETLFYELQTLFRFWFAVCGGPGSTAQQPPTLPESWHAPVPSRCPVERPSPDTADTGIPSKEPEPSEKTETTNE